MADGMLVTGKTYNLTMRNLEAGRIALIGWQSERKRGRKYNKRGGPPRYAALRKTLVSIITTSLAHFLDFPFRLLLETAKTLCLGDFQNLSPVIELLLICV